MICRVVSAISEVHTYLSLFAISYSHYDTARDVKCVLKEADE